MVAMVAVVDIVVVSRQGGFGHDKVVVVTTRWFRYFDVVVPWVGRGERMWQEWCGMPVLMVVDCALHVVQYGTLARLARYCCCRDAMAGVLGRKSCHHGW